MRDVVIGAGAPLVVMAGPCAVESREQVLATARWVKREGATMLRGGAYKPRTSPYAFQGLGVEGLKLLAEVREETGLPIVTEVTDPRDVEVFEQYVDMLQVGARNMQNFVLLKAVGQSRKPVLLKRGLSATIEEWLMAAEYILAAGNPNVVLCERGIRTFETATRNTLDLSAVPVLRERTHLPVMVDPSHGTGHRSLVRPMAVAGAAGGCRRHHHRGPSRSATGAKSDSEQSLSFPEFGDLMDDLRRLEYLRQPTAPGSRGPDRARPATPAAARTASMTSTRGSRRCSRSAPSSRSLSSRPAAATTTAMTSSRERALLERARPRPRAAC